MKRADGVAKAESTRRGWLVARFVLSLCGLLVLASAAAAVFSAELERIGAHFVSHWGYLGMAVGTLLADGFLFPVPPQFYMLLAIATQSPGTWVLLSITAGSLLGGAAGYLTSRRLSRVAWVRRRLATARTIRALHDALGTRSWVALSLSPVAFSWLIYCCGFGNFPWRPVTVVCLLRIPKLVVYYFLVRAGWAVI